MDRMQIEALEWAARLGTAALLSGLIGFEREAHQKAAGLRTHMLVGLGAALFGLLSLEAFDAPDRSRIAAQVVAGVGFLGAGAIFRFGATVAGLTTAAGLWAVAAIGLAAAAGTLIGASIATALALTILYGLTSVERFLRSRRSRGLVPIGITLDGLSEVGRISSIISGVARRAPEFQIHPAGEGIYLLRTELDPPIADLALGAIRALDSVVEADRADPSGSRRPR